MGENRKSAMTLPRSASLGVGETVDGSKVKGAPVGSPGTTGRVVPDPISVGGSVGDGNLVEGNNV
jgi:hypothetical protein